MPQVKRPKRGTMAFYPRKRSAKIYPSVSSFPSSDKPKAMLFAAYKAGMTHVMLLDNKKTSPTFGMETQVPATILECPPLKVIGVRAYHETAKGPMPMVEAMVKEMPKHMGRKIKVGAFKTDEKMALMEKATEKISGLRFVVSTDPLMTAFAKKTPEVFEVEIGGKTAKEKLEFAKTLMGKEIKIQDVVQEGESIDVISVNKGKGTQGPVKRWGIRMLDRHSKQKIRHVGAIAQQVPRKVRHTARHAGQMGFQRRTELNKRVIKIGEGRDVVPASGLHRYGILKSNFVLLDGSIPGPKKRLIMIRPAIRPPKVRVEQIDVRHIAK